MKKLNVIYRRGKGDTFPVGQLAVSGHRVYFEYAPSFLAVRRWTDHAQTAHVLETSKDKIEQTINRNIKGEKLNL